MPFLASRGDRAAEVKTAIEQRKAQSMGLIALLVLADQRFDVLCQQSADRRITFGST